MAPALNGSFTADIYGEEAARIIRAHSHSHAAHDAIPTPLFLYVAFTVVHAPVQATAAAIAHYSNTSTKNYIADTKRRTFGGMVTLLDDACGAIVAALRETGMWPNTVLFFSTDNGSPIGNGGSNAPLRGGKMTMWEGGVRGLAFVASGSTALLPPGVRNTTFDGLAAQTDLYATFAALAGVSAAEFNASGPVPPDSVNLWPAIASGGTIASPRLEVVHNIDGMFPSAIQVGDYKLLVGSPNFAGRGSDGWSDPPEASDNGDDNQRGYGYGYQYKNASLCSPPAPPCLFNIVADPEERNDLSHAMPAKLQELVARLTELRKTEVLRKDSQLCPEGEDAQGRVYNVGGEPDASLPDGCAELADGQHWQPWM